jgi:hypothetical protein
MALAFSVVVVTQSLRQGQLSVPITFDDITYFVDAASRLQALYDNGLQGFIAKWSEYPPHSPWATLTALAGFLIFGLCDWGPAAFNAVWLAAALILLDRLLLRGCQGALRIIVLALALAWPVTSFLVIESRPDIVNGFLLAIGAYFVVSRPWLDASPAHHAAAAAIFGLALLSKPSYSVVSFGMFGLCLLVGSAIDLIESRPRRRWAQFVVVNLKTIALCMLIAAPHYLMTLDRTISYIYTTVFGNESSLWAVSTPSGQSPLLFHAGYYLVGPGGWALMGVWFHLTCILVIACCAMDAICDRRALLRTAGLLLVGAVVWGVISISATKSIFLGAVLACLALLLFSRSLVRIAAHITDARRNVRIAGALALVAFALTTFQWHWYHRQERSTSVESVSVSEKRFRLLADIARVIAPDANSTSTTYFPAITTYLHPGPLTFEQMKRRRLYARAEDNHRVDDFSVHRDAIGNATHVVLFSVDDIDVLRWLPSYNSLAATTEFLEESADFRVVARFPAPVEGGDIRVFARPTPFESLAFDAGFLAEEGPYPQWDMARVRWGTGTQSHVRAAVDLQNATLVLRAQSPFEGQTISVGLGGKREAGLCVLPKAGTFYDCEVLLGKVWSDAMINFKYARSSTDPENPRAVLYAQLRLRPSTRPD